MVSLIERQKYLLEFDEKPKQKALWWLINGKANSFSFEEKVDIDKTYYGFIEAIMKNKKADFQAIYNKLSKRKINKKSNVPFIHDDFLLFVLIIGIQKFSLSDEWLKSILECRSDNQETKTFKNILNKNYKSKSNVLSIVLVYISFLEKKKIDNEILVDTYDFIMNESYDYHNNDFVQIMNYKALDEIILYKSPGNIEGFADLQAFEEVFKKRVRFGSSIIYNILGVVILFLAFKGINSLSQDGQAIIGNLGLLLGIFGVGLTNLIAPVRLYMYNLTLRVFGYKLINN